MARDDERNTAIAMPPKALSAKPVNAPVEVFASAPESSGQSPIRVRNTALGGGTRNAFSHPARTSHSTASVTNTNGIAAGIAFCSAFRISGFFFHGRKQVLHLTRKLRAQPQFVVADPGQSEPPVELDPAAFAREHHGSIREKSRLRDGVRDENDG